MPEISKGLIPHGGWWFQEGEFKLKAPTFNALVETIYWHRKNNGKNLGENISQEVEDQIAARCPYMVVNKVAPAPEPMSTFTGRLSSFASAMLNFILSGGQIVDQNSANIRAEVCAGCHNNVPDKTAKKRTCCGGKILEDVAILATRKKIVGDKKTNSDKSLETCAICGCDNKIQVWFPTNALGMNSENTNAYPTFCWKKQL